MKTKLESLFLYLVIGMMTAVFFGGLGFSFAEASSQSKSASMNQQTNKAGKKTKSSRKKKSTSASSEAPTAVQKRLKKDVSFDDYAVKGKYLVPLNSVTVVEEDKKIDDLIGVRKNFQDRIEASKGMR